MQTLPILGLFMSVVGSVASDYGNSSTGDLEDELLPNETTYECLGPSREDMELYGKLAWWMDGVIQFIIGTLGFVGNFIAIPILLSKRMASIFNRILVCLAIFDNAFIFCSLLEAVRKNFGPLHEVGHVYAFAYFLYQLQSIAIVSSIFTTVVLALERCLAVAKPIEYHNAVQGANPWRRVMSYIVPVFIFSGIFNIPKCFETAVVEQAQQEKRFDPLTNSTEWINHTVIGVVPTDLRMDLDYVFFYNNLTKLVITGLIPFLALCVFNFKIYAALRRRRQTMGPAAAAAHAQQLNEDNRQAVILFGIVIIFLACNTPRVVLNFHEVFTIQQYKEALRYNCHSLPLWVLLMGNFNQLSMMINSSINFFIYCFMSSVFREVLFEIFGKCGKVVVCNKGTGWPRMQGNQQASVLGRPQIDLQPSPHQTGKTSIIHCGVKIAHEV